jgi:ribosomal protein S18 acetylase RimI-like enzyme
MTVREAAVEDAPAIARVHVDTWRATYPGILPDEVLAGLSYERREAMWRRVIGDATSRTFVYVALDGGGQVVGFATGGPEATDDADYAGELYAIYVDPAHQRRGLGATLLTVVQGRLRALGLSSMVIWVAARNSPSCAFYERMGGRAARRRTVEIEGAAVDEIGYGWDASPCDAVERR